MSGKINFKTNNISVIELLIMLTTEWIISVQNPSKCLKVFSHLMCCLKACSLKST
jgi:hypothetical protein